MSSLRALDVPIDMHDSWNRMVDELDEMETDDDDQPGVLTRLRPDAWAVSWGKRQVLLLELTRAHDWRQDWASVTDTAVCPTADKDASPAPTGVGGRDSSAHHRG